MPYLIESIEWRLLQELGRLLKPKIARLRPGPLNDDNAASSQAELFEIELRQVFMIEEFSDILSQKDYDQLQAIMNRLCSLLDNLAKPRSVYGAVAPQTYPRLYELTKSFESLPAVIDLASGSNDTVFKLPRGDDELDRYLRIVTEYNVTLGRLFPPTAQGQTIRPLQSQSHKKGAWKKGRIRNHATFVLGALFEHFKCGTSHEVLLKLIEDPDEGSVFPSLQIVFSLCPESELLQEAWCDSVHLDRASISPIPNICAELRQQRGEGMSLTLLVKEYGLFGTWEGPNLTARGLSSKESLHQLILEGAFKPFDFNTLLRGVPPAKFSIKDKRELAVKLGFCLMDFFDADIASKQIYFLGSSKSHPSKEFPYLAFNSKLPATSDSQTFVMGHPALLSFAKLLLELEFGEISNLSISPHSSQNSGVYVELMRLVEGLELERSDSYVQAIRGCLVVHYKIAKALRSHNLDGKATDFTIRKVLYKEIVKSLEFGLVQSISRPASKRQRSESPPPSKHGKGWEGAQEAGSRKIQTIALRPIKSEWIVPANKRQRTYRSTTPSEIYHDAHMLRLAEVPPTADSQPDTITDNSDRWFTELANMNAVVRVKTEDRDTLSPHVRIAILDTGIESQFSTEIKGYEDFVESLNAKCQDKTGHGTDIFRLIRKVCEDAHFFIGRVWEGSKDTHNTSMLMEKAIDHAREAWKVDIIVLSSGFRTSHSNIGEAIERANMERILTFASPSNYGNMDDIYYPARLYGHGKVICLFSTNSMVRSSTTKTFNPSPLDTAAHRTFAILGEDITLENAKEQLNGTSYSTAIGAGIAARILDFSRYPRFRARIENIDDLKKVEGMLAIFGRMAKRTDNGYRCMTPWGICPRVEEGIGRREARERQQSAVVDELKNALKDIHRA
ncbi:hypothetical protein E0Z10_g2278 [Xylaria hypoxylon]|uniref:Uncharacterized protein n=1 Tax=Xylaria hypoxylon TaxID=37992 RepID=A0A4Z0Z2P0_9PEZI|nr:hypothetical protein E0Z10_g2278 [Xylaria hypoxylon]